MSTVTVVGNVSDRDRAHELLLGLAGRVPDDGLAMMRTFLADDEEPHLAQFLSEAVESGRLPLTAAEESVIGELLSRNGFGMSGPESGTRLEKLPMPTVRFAPTVARDEDDPVDEGPLDDWLADDGLAEQVAVEAVGRLAGVRALWRAWRTLPDVPPSPAFSAGPAFPASPAFPAGPAFPLGVADPFSGEAPVTDPRRPSRVFLFEAGPGADLVELTAELQQWLAEVGEEPPRVEVFGPGATLPPYHEAALAGAVLLWTAEPATEARLARVFDGADAGSGPFFHPDHPVVDGADRDQLLAYLTEAEAVLLTPGTMVDVVDADRGAVVPMTFRSDGVWIWPDTVAYYLREHGLAPDPELAAHVRSVDGPPRPLNRLSHHRVMAVLAGPAPRTPAWRVD